MSKTKPPLNTGDTIELEIHTLTHSGEGLGHYKDFTVFVPQGLPGDQLKIEIISLKPNYARGLIQEILSPSPDRITPPCPVTTNCGGCQWQEFDYEQQLKFKQLLLQETLIKVAKIAPETIQNSLQPIIGMDNPFDYRNKAQFPFQVHEKQIVAGFFQHRSHQVVPLETCYIQHPQINALFKSVLTFCRDYNIPIYDETSQSGFLRHLLVRYGFNTRQLLVGLITRDMPFPHQQELIKKLTNNFPNLVGIVQNINDRPGNTILGQENRTLFGQDYLLDQLGPYHFKINLKAFYQINPVQSEKLYNQVLKLAHLTGKETILDAYAGTGSIAIWLAQQAKEVIGIEVVAEAVQDGQENCRLNQMDNVTLIEGKVEKQFPKLAKKYPFDCAILDPPRKGCEKEVLKTLIKHKVPTIVYVSCNPTTLARDAKILIDNGYQVKGIQGVDMFPHTFHLESVMKFSL